jgi:hypothetical protein
MPDPAPLPAYYEVEAPVRDISPDRHSLDLYSLWDNWQPARPTSPLACCPSYAPVATVVTPTPPPAPTMPVTITLITAPASCSVVSVMAPVMDGEAVPRELELMATPLHAGDMSFTIAPTTPIATHACPAVSDEALAVGEEDSGHSSSTPCCCLYRRTSCA